LSQRAPFWLLPTLALGALGGCLVPTLEVGSAADGGTGTTSATMTMGGATGASGSGGQAGLPNDDRNPLCKMLPITPKSSWIASASTYSIGTGVESDPLFNPPAHVADGSLDERWASGAPQTNGQWLQIDFGETIAVSHVILEQGTSMEDFPRSYRLSLSDQSEDFGALMLAAGEGVSESQIVIPLAHTSIGRYLLIRQTGDAPKWWSVAELLVACQ
jgi:hypothetical protein